jgi:hypothetical protein
MYANPYSSSMYSGCGSSFLNPGISLGLGFGNSFGMMNPYSSFGMMNPYSMYSMYNPYSYPYGSTMMMGYPYSLYSYSPFMYPSMYGAYGYNSFGYSPWYYNNNWGLVDKPGSVLTGPRPGIATSFSNGGSNSQGGFGGRPLRGNPQTPQTPSNGTTVIRTNTEGRNPSGTATTPSTTTQPQQPERKSFWSRVFSDDNNAPSSRENTERNNNSGGGWNYGNNGGWSRGNSGSSGGGFSGGRGGGGSYSAPAAGRRR